MIEDDKYWILLSRYISEDLSSEETDELFEWINADPERLVLLQQAQSAWEQTRNYQETHVTDIDTDAAWLKVKGQLDADVRTEKRGSIYELKWLSIAASLIIFCSLSWYGFRTYDQNKFISIANHKTSKQQVLLPDGSSIWLNKGGAITYKKGLGSLDKREVSLVGEAFFEVNHDAEKPFIIHTGDLETQVLGTSFNVISGDDGIVKVAVVTGKVSFRKTEENGVFLLPGEEGTYKPSKGISKSHLKNTNFLYWKDQTLTFENEAFGTILQEIENSYSVKFKVDDKSLLDQKITTSFKAAPIEEVIIVLESLLDLKITPSGGAYIVVK